MKYRWLPVPPQPLLTDRLAAELQASSLLAQCLVNRGLEEVSGARAFLAPRLRLLTDPFRLPDMAEAVERLFGARERGEAVMIFGD